MSRRVADRQDGPPGVDRDQFAQVAADLEPTRRTDGRLDPRVGGQRGDDVERLALRRQLQVALQPVLRLTLAQEHDTFQNRRNLDGDRFQHVHLAIARLATTPIVNPKRADRSGVRLDRQANGRRRSGGEPGRRLVDFVATQNGPATEQGAQVRRILGQAANRRGDRMRFAVRTGPQLEPLGRRVEQKKGRGAERRQVNRTLQQPVDRIDEVLLGRNRAAQIDERRDLVRPRLERSAGGRQPADELREGVGQVAHRRKGLLIAHVGGQNSCRNPTGACPSLISVNQHDSGSARSRVSTSSVRPPPVGMNFNSQPAASEKLPADVANPGVRAGSSDVVMKGFPAVRPLPAQRARANNPYQDRPRRTYGVNGGPQ